MSTEELDTILRSHGIEPSLSRGDEFEAFFRARTERLIDQIEKVMGKPVNRSDAAAVRAAAH